ncbi:hypothetical protein MUG84_17180 [Paenibacillus sp. KQZ6P-2]|uniref:Copper amine oxidase-like N-terminal domain-containing protein n=1 Tax=Paenibacillus mangrovi TaxID=2931978 RepID=A0A9X1WRS7_9BACL|nr:hypothetical protein [Paenibacillus mangrovi]MCJ8013461.1 hypothetical protein [Paenibacillus mangrovi]
MKKLNVKKVSILLAAGFLCSATISTHQVTFAKQATAVPQAKTEQAVKTLSELKIGQKFIVPELKFKDNTYVLDYKTTDVQGDSVADRVILVGTKEMYNGELDAYASDLSIIVQDGKTQKYTKYDWLNKGTDGTMYGELGREPNLIVGDYTGDKVDDIIVTAPQGGNGGYVDHLVLSWQENKLKVVFADNQATVKQ